jgi:hypothetical protein
MRDEGRGLAEFRRQRAALRFQYVADDHARAFRNEQPSLGGALTAGTAANQDDFVFQTIHRFLPNLADKSGALAQGLLGRPPKLDLNSFT